MSQILDTFRKLDQEKATWKDKPAKISSAPLNSNGPDSRKKICPYLTVAGFAVVAATAMYAIGLGLGILPNRFTVDFFSSFQNGEKAKVAALDSHEPGSNLGEQRIEISPKLRKDGEGKNPGSGRPQSDQPRSDRPSKSSLMSSGHGTLKRQIDEVRELDETFPETPEEAGNEIQRMPANLPDYLDERSRIPPVDPMGRPLMRRRDRALSANKTIPDEKLKAQSGAAAPLLRLSAIIWYEDPSKRRTAVSGKILSEGSSLQGVKVVEIRPTSVLFSENGQPLEISINR